MSEIRERIEKTIKAIAKAASNGKDTTQWQEHLIQLVEKLDNPTVTVKFGTFGFCTCTEKWGLCFGCYKIKKGCECEEREVDPNIELTKQYKAKTEDAYKSNFSKSDLFN